VKETASWATIIVEIVGGLLILAGAFVPVATVPMIVVLLVAIFTVHLPNGFSSIKLMSYDAAGAHFGQPGMTPTCCISRASSRSASEAQGLG
jgi:putative oxidoreductase